MAGKAKYDWPDNDQLVPLVASSPSVRECAQANGWTYAGLNSRIRDQGIGPAIKQAKLGLIPQVPATRTVGSKVERPGVTVKGDTATAYTPVAGAADLPIELGDCEALIKNRGLDPLDWEVKSVTVNEWESNAGDGEIITLHQLKLNMVRVVTIEWPTPPPCPKRRVPIPRALVGKPFQWLALPDPHAPYHDVKLIDQLIGLSVRENVDGVFFLGDDADFPTISKHRDTLAFNAAVQDCIDGAVPIFSGFRDALPDAEIKKLLGNHDWRLSTEQLNRAERLADIHAARLPGETEDKPHPFSPRQLFRLDDLHIELIEPTIRGDEYDHAEYWLAPSLVAIHGKHTGSRTKTGAMQHAQRMGASVVMGHTHRQNITTYSQWGPGGTRQELVAAELGTCRVIDQSAGYVDRPNWQPGAGLITVYPDGQHNIELIRWQNNQLVFRGQRW